MNNLRYFFNHENSTFKRNIVSLALVCVIILVVFILYVPPVPGVADQGDFQRVMSVTGLEELDRGTLDFESHWFKYTISKYRMLPLERDRLTGKVPTTSLIYPIALTRLVCRLANTNKFNTRILAAVYSIIYIIAFYLCIINIRIKLNATLILFIFLSIFILFDGCYLVWFNSLYGEPMMISGFLLFIGTLLRIGDMQKTSDHWFLLISFPAALLFLGSKLQCFPILPINILIIVRLILNSNKFYLNLMEKLVFCLMLFLLIRYVYGIYSSSNSSLGVDTAYNSVFYGILKNSRNPETALTELGLAEDMAVEAGKHAYLPREDYVKYIPWSEITIREFNKKISNWKLLKYYLHHPAALFSGMEYTASQSFNTSSYLGKYEKTEVNAYTYNFNRFTLWSRIRNLIIPKNIYFILVFYLTVFLVSAFEYSKTNISFERIRIEILWFIAVTGILQFPMPFIGNGEADTSKQLFLFNLTFDILIMVCIAWMFNKLYKFFKKFLILHKTPF